MSKGRTTTSIGLRVKDKLLARLDAKGAKLGMTRAEMLIPMVRLCVMGGDRFFVQDENNPERYHGVQLVKGLSDASVEDDEYHAEELSKELEGLGL